MAKDKISGPGRQQLPDDQLRIKFPVTVPREIAEFLEYIREKNGTPRAHTVVNAIRRAFGPALKAYLAGRADGSIPPPARLPVPPAYHDRRARAAVKQAEKKAARQAATAAAPAQKKLTRRRPA